MSWAREREAHMESWEGSRQDGLLFYWVLLVLDR